MKKLMTLVFALALVAGAFAQIQEPRPMAAALNEVGIFNLPEPTPVCVTPQQTSIAVPVGNPAPMPLPQVQQVALQAFCLQSNGLKTSFRVTVSDPFDVGISFYIQNADQGEHVESFILGFGNRERPISRYDRSGFIDANGAWLYKLGTAPDVSAQDFTFNGSTMAFSFANSDIGNEGRPAGITFYLYDKRDGQAKSVFPATGYAKIPATLSVSLSPSTGTTLYRLLGKPSRFNLVAGISSLMGPSAVTTMWVADGRDNITDMLNSQSVMGIFPLQAIPVNQPILQQYTRRIDYDVNNLHNGVRFRITVLSPVGVAYDEVVYNIQDTLESPSLPLPRP